MSNIQVAADVTPATAMPAAPSTAVAARDAILEHGRRASRRYLEFAALLLLAGLGCGLVSALHYTPLAGTLNAIGLRLSALRPLHTGATVGWIFFAGMAMVHRWMFEHLADRHGAGDAAVWTLAEGVAGRARIQRRLWVASGVLAGLALLSGYTSGREYLEYPPLLSIPIVAGWLLYGYNFAMVTRYRLARMPVFAWMWGTSVFLFLWTFGEAHLYLLDALALRPVRDLAIQWKSAGSLVGSFNLLVYGSMSWMGTKLSGNDKYARSNVAFLLFLLGVLNSFTNYGHHTYHLPQSEWVKGIAFGISMTEAIILVRVTWDVAGIGKKWASRGRFPTVHALAIAMTVWTFVQLAIAIPYSIPFLNTYVHGTLAVVAHSMGSLIGIDTMALLAAGVWLVHERDGEPAAVRARGVRAVVVLNVCLGAFFLALFGVGVLNGIRLVHTGVLPWIGQFPAWLGPVLLATGALMTMAIAMLVRPMLPAWRAPAIAADPVARYNRR